MGASTGKLASERFFRSWSCEDTAKGVVLISHGLGEHSGRYNHVAQAFTANHLHVYALDHIGHGESPGKRAFVESFNELTAGVAELRSHIASEHPDLPVVLIGHSMGGLIAARTVLDAATDYQTLILTGPLLGVPTPPPAWQTWLLRTLSALFPAAKALEIDASAVSRDQAVVDDMSLIHWFIMKTSLPEPWCLYSTRRVPFSDEPVKFLCQRYCCTVRKMY